jgi:hypothetical protein
MPVFINESGGVSVMTILHSGSNNKYSSNWMKAFQRGKAAASAKPAAMKRTKKSSKKKEESRDETDHSLLL